VSARLIRIDGKRATGSTGVSASQLAGLLDAARSQGYAEVLAVHDSHLATARAQQARAAFSVIRGGRALREGGAA
jgi:hypothetical protein